jgi:hypothetical protein
MRILFFIEPIIFRDNPGLLGTWLGWISEIIRANDDAAAFGIASSPALCRRLRVRTQGRD